MKKYDTDPECTESRVVKADTRLQFSCSFCPPHSGENQTYKKRSPQKKKKSWK